MWTASALSRNCAHHRVLSDLHPNTRRDAAAKKGTAFHAALKEWRDSGVVPTMADEVGEWLATMVAHGWAWPNGCELEVAWGLSTWGTFSPVEETAPHAYRALDGEELITAGRADACWMADGVLVSCDWKTGRTQAPFSTVNLQVNAAGLALAQKWKARAYLPLIYYAREARWDSGLDVEQGTPAWERAWQDVKAAAALDDKPHPGPHCGDCWERKHCEAA